MDSLKQYRKAIDLAVYGVALLCTLLFAVYLSLIHILSSTSLLRSIRQAVSRFWIWLRSFWHCTTMPVGIWVNRKMCIRDRDSLSGAAPP